MMLIKMVRKSVLQALLLPFLLGHGIPCPPDGRGPRCSQGNRNGQCKLIKSCKGEYSTSGCLTPSPVTCCLDCQNPIDLVFVLDSSGNVQPTNFRIRLQFIIKVCQYFNISYPLGTRVAVTTYNQSATIIFHLNTFIRKQDVLNAIAAIQYQGGDTRTNLALSKAYTNLFGNPENGVRPKELGVPRVLVLLTDGRTSSGTDSIIRPSNLLREEGVNIFMIGIGQNITKIEMDIIASDPDSDHVFLLESIEEKYTLLENIQEALCYEPALLEEGREIGSSVDENAARYFKYDLFTKAGIKTVFLETTLGQVDIAVSTSNKNPRNNRINLGSCEPHDENKLSEDSSNSRRLWELEELENDLFCEFTFVGGFTKPRFVLKDEFIEEGMVVYVRMCSNRWFYVSVEGINKANKFNLTLFEDLIRINKRLNITVDTFPIPKRVYAGAVAATIGTATTIAAVVTLSCAKEFEVKSSARIKKKKKKECETTTDTNCYSTINKGFQEDDETQPSTRGHGSSLTPSMEKDGLQSNSCRKSIKKETAIEVTKPENSKRSNYHIKEQGKGCVVEMREKQLTQKHPSCVNEDPHMRKVNMVSAMIHDFQREDTFREKTMTSIFQRRGDSQRWNESRFGRQEMAEDEIEVHVRNGEKDKVSLLVRLKSKLTKRKILAIMCPCFTYLILKGETKEKEANDGKRKDDIQRQEMRNSRFERDMQMSQTFCVLISQLLFVLGADARDYKIACAVVGITMNYLALVTLCWLIVQALYLLNFTRARESEGKQHMKFKLYFAGAWGLPLFAVLFLVFKYETFHKHPHCWISFADTLSWSVATPMITLGMVEIILIILLAKALVTYRKSDTTEENKYKKTIIKTGIRTVVCITISVVLTWLLGSLSLNIDRGVYHTCFSIFTAMQGVAFFLFYVLLNPKVRQFILSVWEWKNSFAETPFDEHEAIEIEEEKEKDKRKGNNEPAGKRNGSKDERQTKQENKSNGASLSTIQTVTEAKKVASCLVTNTKTNNKGNAFGAKSDVQKFVEDPRHIQKIADARTSTKNKKLRSLSPSAPPLRKPARAWEKR